jgi:hypothetical protein
MMSFDTTIVELLPAESDEVVVMQGRQLIRPGRYGVVELQTADTHGTYKHAVAALRAGLDLHPAQFHAQLASNPVDVKLVIGTDAGTLGRAALETAPTKAVGLGVHQGVVDTIVLRLRMALGNDRVAAP